uniref:Uncharacterized protein n=1 Tax=Anopheles maculatus TaxID=74869 RepID=A0A182T7W8_9DIPT
MRQDAHALCVSFVRREFITECLFPTTKSPYELPWQLKTAWGVVFGAMLLVAITGNCIVLWIVLGKWISSAARQSLFIRSINLLLRFWMEQVIRKHQSSVPSPSRLSSTVEELKFRLLCAPICASGVVTHVC